ncbi:MAG: 50S ribosomal protein L10 [Prevotella sp.]|nr:50S ribosomal protein L10 [Prevotella sp.]MCM1074398.1 50S ribosomal protein L10 [Ruminococcus sp.]
MKKEDKAQVIEMIGKTLADYSCVYLTQTSGLDAEKTSSLRRACFKAEVKMLCVKNTLLKEAFKASENDYSGLYDLLHGETTLLLSNSGNAPAKLIKKFRGKEDTLPMLKGAYVEETVYVGEENLETLANIKSKNELIADVVALLQSPAKNVISALNSGAGKLHGILETLSKKEN